MASGIQIALRDFSTISVQWNEARKAKELRRNNTVCAETSRIEK